MQRIDTFLVEHDLAESREQAKRLILAGAVTVNGNASIKPGQRVPDDAEVIVKEGQKYVSRGGFKLEKALSTFNIDARNRVALDVGASTGGFTDCLLQHGAKFVYAVDVGYGQLAWKLRTHRQVKSIEKTNIRHLTPALLKTTSPPISPRMRGDMGGNENLISIAVIDVSFISLRTVLPSVIKLLKKQEWLSAKRQSAIGKEAVGKEAVGSRQRSSRQRNQKPKAESHSSDSRKPKAILPIAESHSSDNRKPKAESHYDIIALLKPQFEAGKAHVKKGGVVSDKQVHIETIDNLSTFVTEKLGATVHGLTYSPIHKDIRNIEYLLWLTINLNPNVSKSGKDEQPKQTTAEVVADAHESFVNS